MAEGEWTGKQGSTDRIACCLVLAACVLLVYWGVQHHDFVNIDDPAYVLENRHVQEGLGKAGFLWALGGAVAGNWHPLTLISLAADYELYGLYPGGYHWTNVILHLLATMFLFLALERMTGRSAESFVVAALFGIHPLHVESVAWVAERKDVLSGFFWITGLWFYARYAELGGWRNYGLVLAAFVMGLMSKPMVVTFPFVLLLLDYWPLGRFGTEARAKQALRLIAEKVPLFFLTLVSGIVTYHVQQQVQAMMPSEVLPFWWRVGNAFVSYGRYILKAVWPVGLSVFYPHPGLWSGSAIAGSVLFFAAVSGAVLYCRRRHPYLLTGWLWYVGTLVPVIGLVQVGEQAMADRYTYLPLTGLFIMLAWATGGWVSRGTSRRAIAAGAAMVFIMACLIGVSRGQAAYWKDSMALFGHALQVTKNNHFAHNNLGAALFEAGKIGPAIAHYREALRISPADLTARRNLGLALAALGRHDEAIAQYEWILRRRPGDPSVERSLADALMARHKAREASVHYRRALAGDPDDPELHNNIGVALWDTGDRPGAILHFRKALQLRPGYADARRNLDKALKTGDTR